MAKISLLPLLPDADVDGTETLPVIHGGAMRRILASPFIQKLAQPYIALAQAWASSATPPDPADPASKSAKTIATEARADMAAIAGVITRVRKMPGWLFGIRDLKKRLLLGVTDAGAVMVRIANVFSLEARSILVTGSLRIGESVSRSAVRYPGILYAWTDAKRRRILSILTDGTVWAQSLSSPRITATQIRSRSCAVYSNTAIAFTAKDANGDFQVHRQVIATGVVTQLTTAGNHTDLRINGSVVTWLTNGSYSEYFNLDTEATGRVIARQKLAAIGHSMLADYQTSRQPPLPHRIATILGWDVQDFAIQGQQSSQQVARMGLVPLTVTLSGDQIPASGPVTITTRTPNDWIASAYGPRSIYGTLAGVYGYATWDASAGERFFRAQDGAAVAVPAGSTFVPDIADAFNGVVLIWSLVNDGAGSQAQRDASLANLTTIVNAQKALGRRFVILTELNRGTEPVGSGGYNNIMALNAMLKAAYPNNVFDARQALVDAYNPALPADVTAHSEDRPAPSLREDDDFHPNNAGNAVLAPLIAAWIIAKGWTK